MKVESVPFAEEIVEPEKEEDCCVDSQDQPMQSQTEHEPSFVQSAESLSESKSKQFMSEQNLSQLMLHEQRSSNSKNFAVKKKNSIKKEMSVREDKSQSEQMDQCSITESEDSKASEKAVAPSDASLAKHGSSSKEIVYKRPIKGYVEQANKQTQVTKTEIIEEKGDRKFICQTCGEVFAHG